MKKLIIGLILLNATSAYALCGDVSGDGRVTTTDALMVLREAVGLRVKLKCNATKGVAQVNFTNGLLCTDDGDFTARLTTNGQSWVSPTGITSASQPVPSGVLGPQFTVEYVSGGLCGLIFLPAIFDDLTVTLPPGRLVAVEFSVNSDVTAFTLEFFDVGPVGIASNASRLIDRFEVQMD